jgi:GT2 family glycosyltransferase
MAPTVSVVIPTRNAAVTLGDQLGALAGQDFTHPFEVIVVDNASTDGSAAVANAWRSRMPNLRVECCDRIGANAARNAGVKAARAPRVVTCDADDVVDTSWVRHLSEALGTWSIVGGSTRVDLLNDAEAIRRRRNPVETELPKAFGAYPYGLGASLGFRRDLFDALDGFDEEFRYGADEIDFCWRARHAGFEIGFVPDAVIQYRLRGTTRESMRQTFVYAQADIQLYKKHYELGELPHLTRRLQLWRAFRRLLPLLRIDEGFHAETRPIYLREVARYSGWIVGWMRYGIFV